VIRSRHLLALAACLSLAAASTAPATASTLGHGPDSAHGRPASHRLGSIVRIAPVPTEHRLDGAGPSFAVWYRSTSWSGEPTVVSGTIAVPAGHAPRGGWPVISFGHGLSGAADACAPSRTGPSPQERATQEALVKAGYVIAVSDYQGLGTPGPPSIGHGVATAESLIDIVRAARQVAPASREWAAVGYSLGGQAALFTGAVAPSYAPELRERGIVGLAAVSQWHLLNEATGDPERQVVPPAPFVVLGLEQTYGRPDFHAADQVTPLGLELVEQARTTCIVEMIGKLAGVTNADFYRDPAAATATQNALLAAQEIPVSDYGIPVRLAHGTNDEVPALLSQVTAGQLAAAGTDARFIPIEGADHITLQPMIADQVVDWVDGFFAH
jgi:hypothetical protein